MHGLDAQGKIITGVEVFRQMYAAVGLGWVLSTRLPIIRNLANLGYKIFACDLVFQALSLPNAQRKVASSTRETFFRKLIYPAMLTVNQNGIYCEQGKFYLDPWRPVDRAIISHAHSDHAR